MILFIPGLCLLASEHSFDKPVSVISVAKELIFQIITDVQLIYFYSHFPILWAPWMAKAPANAISLPDTVFPVDRVECLKFAAHIFSKKFEKVLSKVSIFVSIIILVGVSKHENFLEFRIL